MRNLLKAFYIQTFKENKLVIKEMVLLNTENQMLK